MKSGPTVRNEVRNEEAKPLLVVTGGEGFLAKAVAARFAADAWQVDCPGHRELDVADPRAVAAWFAARPTPDLLVCAAGMTCDRPLARLTEADWDQVLEVNLAGAARCAQAVSAGMARHGAGHIVFVSSYSAVHPPVGQAAYAAAKAGLLGLARALAQELGPFGVRVNTVMPGFLDTPMTRALPTARREQVRAQHLLGRCNGVEQAAAFLHFLHQALPHTSGQVFSLDSRVL